MRGVLGTESKVDCPEPQRECAMEHADLAWHYGVGLGTPLLRIMASLWA
jgi:hypothetical protein